MNLSCWGIKIRHPLWLLRWQGSLHQLILLTDPLWLLCDVIYDICAMYYYIIRPLLIPTRSNVGVAANMFYPPVIKCGKRTTPINRALQLGTSWNKWIIFQLVAFLKSGWIWWRQIPRSRWFRWVSLPRCWRFVSVWELWNCWASLLSEPRVTCGDFLSPTSLDVKDTWPKENWRVQKKTSQNVRVSSYIYISVLYVY